jgi:hypothetical protein
MASGTVRRYVTRAGGRDLLVQLPTCYTPSGLLSDFDDGGRIDLAPVDSGGEKDVEAFLALCSSLLPRPPDEEAAPGLPSLAAVVPVSGGVVTASAARVRDVRIFEAEDLPADDCAVLAGDTVTAIVSPEYVWVGKKRRGLHVRLVQLFLHTDRGRYRSFMFSGCERAGARPPPPPPPPGAWRPERTRRPVDPESREASRPALGGRGGYKPSLMEIVTAKNSLKKTARDAPQSNAPQSNATLPLPHCAVEFASGSTGGEGVSSTALPPFQYSLLQSS